MDAPLDIAVPLLVALVVGLNLLHWGIGGRRRTRRWRGEGGPRPVPRHEAHAPSSRVPDAADQLRAVEHADYGHKPLLRFQESKVFAAAEAAVHEAGVPWRVFAQVSLGEVLTCADREGFNAINAKRVDLLIADEAFTPLAAIEYQGTGHHLGQAAARDAVKKEALRKAGVRYIEITHEHGPEDVRREIGRLAYGAASALPKERMRRFAAG